MKRIYPYQFAIAGCALLFSSISLFPVLGTYAAFFKSHIVSFALTGLLGSTFSSGLYIAMKLVLTGFGAGLKHALLRHAASIITMFVWRSKTFEIATFVACACAFILHPMGAHISLYTFHWIIPIALIVISRRSLFINSLIYSYLLHACGSVIWLYTKSIALTHWIFLTLNPLVIGERIALAASITICYYMITFAQNIVAKRFRLKAANKRFMYRKA